MKYSRVYTRDNVLQGAIFVQFCMAYLYFAWVLVQVADIYAAVGAEQRLAGVEGSRPEDPVAAAAAGKGVDHHLVALAAAAAESGK